MTAILEFLLDSKDLSTRLRRDQGFPASDLKGSSFRLVLKASKRALPFYFMDLKPTIFPKEEKKKKINKPTNLTNKPPQL